jgi:hypothetical protein
MFCHIGHTHFNTSKCSGLHSAGHFACPSKPRSTQPGLRFAFNMSAFEMRSGSLLKVMMETRNAHPDSWHFMGMPD